MKMRQRPLNVMFIITSMPVGGAETLLVNLVRSFDPARIVPHIACLKEKGPLGEEIAGEIPVYSDLINHKFDIGILGRLKNLFAQHNIDAVVTVGAGDKMFWGRLAAKRARVPVVLSALHSTGWPDGVGRMNRLLTPLTDGFIACADSHGEFLRDFEKFPKEKVFVIQNGIDIRRFRFCSKSRASWRGRLGIPESSPVVGIVAALRPEKNHALFLNSASAVWEKMPTAQFVIAGDGPERPMLESLTDELGLRDNVHFVGSTSDIPGFLSMLDLFALTSLNEAKPVSILEALSCQRPVVATHVGSVNESVIDGVTGFLVPSEDPVPMSQKWIELLSDSELRSRLGTTGRAHVEKHSSIESMTRGYTELVENVFNVNCPDISKSKSDPPVSWTWYNPVNSTGQAQRLN